MWTSGWAGGICFFISKSQRIFFKDKSWFIHVLFSLLLLFHSLHVFHIRYNWGSLVEVRIDSKPPLVLRIHLGILADFNNAVVSVLPLISYFSSFFPSTLRAVPSALTMIGITIMFQSFSISQARSKYLFIFSLSHIFTL